MQNTPSSPATWVYLRLHVWGLAIASGVTVFLASLVKMVFHLMHGGEYHLSGAPGVSPSAETMAHYSSFGPWHVLAPVVHGVLVGVAAAIFAAIYNAISFRRTA